MAQRIGDGPDQVHLAAVGKELIKRGGVMGSGCYFLLGRVL
jgi:hypothetical protein